MTGNVIRKRYLSTDRGQIHARTLESDGEETRPPLVCLHPAPYSGAYFTTVMPLINEGRRVIAPDYPGYGGSYPLAEPPSIADYANALVDSVLEAERGRPVDLLGFHSGCLVAAEMSLIAPARVRHLLLIDIPYFDSETQQTLYGQVAGPLPLTHEFGSVKKAWDFNVASRKDIVPLDRAFAMFVDQLRSGRHDYFCFHAAFTYDCIGRFAQIQHPTTIIATRSPLTGATHAAAKALANATLTDLPDITTSVFEQGAPVIARHVGDVRDDA